MNDVHTEKTADRIVKLLELTASDHDAEALNSIRLANKIIKSNGLNWREFLLVFAELQKPHQQINAYNPYTTGFSGQGQAQAQQAMADDGTDEMFSYLQRPSIVVQEKNKKFVASLLRWKSEHRIFTPAQRDALWRVARAHGFSGEKPFGS